MSYTIALRPLRKYAQFRGRASRMEFWLFSGFVLAVMALLELVVIILGREGGPAAATMAPDGGVAVYATLVFLTVSFVTFLPSLAVTARRLHDTNRSAWRLLLWTIPIVGWLIMVILCAKPGDRAANRYGDPPEEYGEPPPTPEPETG